MTESDQQETRGKGVRVREVVAGLPTYIAGKPALPNAYKVSSNENPFPPLPSVVQRIAEAAADINRYPDPACTALRGTLSTFLGVDPSSLALSTGSVSMLQHLVSTVAGEGDEVMYAWRSFEAYPIIVGVAGATAVQVPLTEDLRHDLVAMADAVTERTRLIIVCSPNNPTGTTTTSTEFEAFMRRVPEHVLVILDEAYVEFVADQQAVSGSQEFSRYPNLVVLRTFSKAYGLAGLRVGYAMLPPALAPQVAKAVTPFGVNSLAQAAAMASLEEPAKRELDQRVVELQFERARVEHALADQGWPVTPSQGNFVFLALGDKSQDFADHCNRGGLVVRAYGADGVRITIDTPAANDRAISLCREWRAFSKAARII
ncbi:histidinol-phosphate transaminase [Micrococcales bacterium 31B]|nr:histidinol-phosphate transaminase [Micrococcales bacterium 31B]